LNIVKAHAYGNDFLLAPADGAPGDLPALARAACHRHTGVGADGLILYTLRERGATMKLLNADGSWSELSGNGLRCLAAFVAHVQDLRPGVTVSIDSDAGVKTLDFLAQDGCRYEFRAAMGHPADIRQVTIAAAGETLTATVLRTGNPQCVVLGPLPAPERFNTLGPALSTHAMFPDGTNVEFAQVDAPDRVRILIWERGVGPTEASGTGACAAAVAAIRYGGASRDLQIVSPGGTQRVEWTDEGLYLTGSAVLIAEISWRDANLS
jgi:diaminopimelate epimerase